MDRSVNYLPGNDIDNASHCVGSIQFGPRALQDLNAFNIGQGHWQIEIVVARLRVTDLDPVDQEQRLFKSSTTNRHVGLYPRRSPPPDVHA